MRKILVAMVSCWMRITIRFLISRPGDRPSDYFSRVCRCLSSQRSLQTSSPSPRTAIPRTKRPRQPPASQGGGGGWRIGWLWSRYLPQSERKMNQNPLLWQHVYKKSNIKYHIVMMARLLSFSPPHPPTSSHSSRGVPTTNRGVLWLTLQIGIDSDFLLFK